MCDNVTDCRREDQGAVVGLAWNFAWHSSETLLPGTIGPHTYLQLWHDYRRKGGGLVWFAEPPPRNLNPQKTPLDYRNIGAYLGYGPVLRI